MAGCAGRSTDAERYAAAQSLAVWIFMSVAIASDHAIHVRQRFSAIELLVALAVLLVTFPFVEQLPIGALIESILFTLVLVSAVLAVSARRRTLIIAAFLAVPTLVGRWFHDYRPDILPAEVFLIGGIVFLAFVIAQLLRFALTAPAVSTEVLCASISAYLLLGLLWTFCYWLVAEVVPNAFTFSGSFGPDPNLMGFEGIYFSFITLSTVGYGDITPATNVARMLAASEAITGLLYVAVLIARLVALHTASKTDHD